MNRHHLLISVLVCLAISNISAMNHHSLSQRDQQEIDAALAASITEYESQFLRNRGSEEESLEEALRLSLQEPQPRVSAVRPLRPALDDDDQELQQALSVSLNTARTNLTQPCFRSPSPVMSVPLVPVLLDEDEELKRALEQSLQEHNDRQTQSASTSRVTRGSSREDEALQQALALSLQQPTLCPGNACSSSSLGRSVQPIMDDDEEDSSLMIPAGVPQKLNGVIKSLRNAIADHTDLKPLMIVGSTAEFRRNLANTIAKNFTLRVLKPDLMFGETYSERQAEELAKQMFTDSQGQWRSMIVIDSSVVKPLSSDSSSVCAKKQVLYALLQNYAQALSKNFFVVFLVDNPKKRSWLPTFKSEMLTVLDFRKAA